jgi:hypothetical protein
MLLSVAGWMRRHALARLVLDFSDARRRSTMASTATRPTTLEDAATEDPPQGPPLPVFARI